MWALQKHDVNKCSVSVISADDQFIFFLSPSILVSFLNYKWKPPSFIHHSRSHSPPWAL